MSKKIGIITYHDSDNFGSVLQSYALSHYINGLGKDCEIIDYRKKEVKNIYRVFRQPTSRNAILTDIFQIPYYLKLFKRKKVYESFRRTYLPLSDKQFTIKEQLKDTDYDICIVGSDQVWNVNLFDFDSSYFLDFTDAKKFSYAASFGSRPQNINDLLPFLPLIKNFDKITVRETAGKEICENDLKVPAELVCDPVFLLEAEEWRKIKTQPLLNEDYVFCYFAGGVSKELEEYSSRLARENNCKRVIVMFDWHDWNKKDLIRSYESGPSEFVTLLDNAKFVCTNSFHGTAFSIMLDKHFYVERSYRDARVENLLSLFNKKHLLLNSKEDFNEDQLPCDSLDDLIESSKKYIQTIVNS